MLCVKTFFLPSVRRDLQENIAITWEWVRFLVEPRSSKDCMDVALRDMVSSHGGNGLTVGLDDPRDLSSHNDSMILFTVRTKCFAIHLFPCSALHCSVCMLHFSLSQYFMSPLLFVCFFQALIFLSTKDILFHNVVSLEHLRNFSLAFCQGHCCPVLLK